ncbi:uroporphyrinogen-III synthase [Brevibacterium album]|uniref:uroporphyrinogen-III synthase n=1 Tax=Brevibacterium album TaxID=417948 RepID=UPI0003F89DC0|nr:uroporphyrinogen-III synthase [Brevibacterium album]
MVPDAEAGQGALAVPTVYFLGAGPGDPALVTYRGTKLLQKAALIVSDEPRHAAIVDEFVPEATPRMNAEELGQAATTRGRKLAGLAREHGMVVRIVPHDGVLFSTTTDEAAAVRRQGVDFEIVPGVGVAATATAFTGAPVTTNRVRSVRFVEAGEQSHVDVSKHRNTGHVLTGAREDIESALGSLLGDGWDEATPVLLSSDLSTIAQQTIESTFGAAVERLRETFDEGTQVTMLFGQGIAQHAELDWFETRPLFGWSVLIPRTKEQGSHTARALAELGATGTIVPTIAIQPPRTPTQMERAIQGLVNGDYQWVGLTSVNAVRAVREWFDDLGLDARALAGVRVAAVGGPTAHALEDWGVTPDLVPSGEHSARGLVEDWPDRDPLVDPVGRVLLPRADIATEVLVEGLTAGGWDVHDVTAYRTVRAAPPPAPIRESIKAGDFDAVLFTSSSTVRNLVGIAGKPPASTVVACIGPATAQTAEDHGLAVDVLAAEANMGSLIAGLVDHAVHRRSEDLAAGRAPLRPSQRPRRR